MNQQSDKVIIFTDGSSRGNPGPGGFGAIIIAPKNYELGIMNYEIKEIGGREAHTTNNRMELTAAIKALQQIQDSRFKIQVYSDSSYLINGITKWIHGWEVNGWKTKAKQEVENRDLWEALSRVSRGKRIAWKQIGGHVGVAGNTRCDEIATAFADGATPQLYADVLPNYSIKNILNVGHDTGMAKEKSKHRTHSSAKAYSYVSAIKGVIQTHKTWAECEARVKGKAARYKKVLSADEEKRLIEAWNGQS